LRLSQKSDSASLLALRMEGANDEHYPGKFNRKTV
jgi:hypothetical protein